MEKERGDERENEKNKEKEEKSTSFMKALHDGILGRI